MSTDITTAQQQETDYEDTPAGWANRWKHELKLARQELEPWHQRGDEVVKRFRDERKAGDKDKVKWNLFTSTTETKQATLYGQTPSVEVTRKFADAEDDVARVAGEMTERILNADIQSEDDTYAEALAYALEDRQLPGLGLARIRFVAEFETTQPTPPIQDEETGELLAPEVPAVEKVRPGTERVETDYVHWRDVLWGPARVWHEVPWVAFRSELSPKELKERFPKEGPLVQVKGKARAGEREEEGKPTPWARAVVWEIWHREDKRVYWYAEGHPRVLDIQDDPLGLRRFFPCPKPMMALTTTTACVPCPEYYVAQDLYEEVDSLSQRIKLLLKAVKAAGVYNKEFGAHLQQLLDADDNVLLPMEAYGAFQEKGGLNGIIDWMPIEQLVKAIAVLSQHRQLAKDALYEVTGMADIMRGAGGGPGTSATEQAIKAKFGSVRLQKQQDEFAKFATELQRLKFEVMAKHFTPQTLIAASNVMATPDRDKAQAAVQLLKSDAAFLRIDVKPESVALQDFAQLKGEALELAETLTRFLQGIAPLAQNVPGAMPYVLRLLQASLSRLRGASALEGILDQAIAAAERAASQPQPQQQGPSPEQAKLEAVRLKGQLDLAKEDKKLEHDIVRTQVETAAKAQQEAVQREENVMEAQQKHALQLGARDTDGPARPGGVR